MKSVIVLAMHGMPPTDFPREELAEFSRLHSRLTREPDQASEQDRFRHEGLDKKIRMWPRTPDNDPFFIWSHDVSAALKRALTCEVLVGFNEFCTPTIEAALEAAANLSPSEIVVTTPMMGRGGSHAEREIPEVIATAQKKHPQIVFRYAWPFPSTEIADFLATQIRSRH